VPRRGAVRPYPRTPAARDDDDVFKRVFQEEAAEILAEAEATRTGRLLERHGWQEDVPGWIVVNALAHRDWDGLAGLADGGGADPERARDAVVAFLASETLSTAGSPEGLDALQHAYLVPLELQLLGSSAPAPLPPIAVVTAVRARLA
jgi:hypothetical protein